MYIIPNSRFASPIDLASLADCVADFATRPYPDARALAIALVKNTGASAEQLAEASLIALRKMHAAFVGLEDDLFDMIGQVDRQEDEIDGLLARMEAAGKITGLVIELKDPKAEQEDRS